jgi:hypothetical protein
MTIKLEMGRKFPTLLRGGILGLAVPLSFDAILSLLSQSLGSYAPPLLYPIFFILGAAGAWDGMRARENIEATQD